MTEKFTGNGGDDEFIITHAAASNTAIVSINGIIQAPTTDYTVMGDSVQFVIVPEDGDEIVVSYYYAS